MKIERIVLVDDNDDDNFYHARVIRKSGFTGELLTLEDGFQALAFVNEDPLTLPTLILLDINMPGMNGFEVAEQVEPIVIVTPTTILVMLTSSSSPDDIGRAKRTKGISGFLTKPLTVERVLRLVYGELDEP